MQILLHSVEGFPSYRFPWACQNIYLPYNSCFKKQWSLFQLRVQYREMTNFSLHNFALHNFNRCPLMEPSFMVTCNINPGVRWPKTMTGMSGLNPATFFLHLDSCFLESCTLQFPRLHLAFLILWKVYYGKNIHSLRYRPIFECRCVHIYLRTLNDIHTPYASAPS